MKKLSMILLALMLMNSGFAQNNIQGEMTTKSNDSRTSLYLYGGIGCMDWFYSLLSLEYNGNLMCTHYDAGILGNRQISPQWSVGLGSEFHGSKGLLSYCGFWGTPASWMDKDFLSLPVYANVRFRMGDGDVVPYFEAKLGYAFSLNTVYGVWRFDVYDHTNTTYSEPGFQGTMKAGGLYSGLAFGVDVGRHGFVLGATCMPLRGDFIDYNTNETFLKTGPMLNSFLRYSFALLR